MSHVPPSPPCPGVSSCTAWCCPALACSSLSSGCVSSCMCLVRQLARSLDCWDIWISSLGPSSSYPCYVSSMVVTFAPRSPSLLSSPPPLGWWSPTGACTSTTPLMMMTCHCMMTRSALCLFKILNIINTRLVQLVFYWQYSSYFYFSLSSCSIDHWNQTTVNMIKMKQTLCDIEEDRHQNIMNVRDLKRNLKIGCIFRPPASTTCQLSMSDTRIWEIN